MVPSITSIINNSIASGIFPDELKKARVLPIFKSGDSEIPENHGPIYILPILSKIFERHFADQMQECFMLTPQGPILGPILFIMYINDMVYSCPDKAVDLYADDSTLHKSGTNINDIQNRLQNDYNNRTLHPGKSKCMLIVPLSKLSQLDELQLTINGQKLENVKHKQV